MPHAEIKYSDDLDLPLADMFRAIEETINRHDPAAGACKCRAYPAQNFHHTHVLIELSLLAKPTRGAAFSAALIEDLERALKGLLAQPCAFSMGLSYSSSMYITNTHDP